MSDLLTNAIQPTGEVATGWSQRSAVAIAAQKAHEALFEPNESEPIVGPSVPQRRALAARVARQHGAQWLAEHHEAALAGESAEVGDSYRDYADLLSLSPALITGPDTEALLDAGLSPDELVVNGQIVALTVFQARLVAGLRLLSGHDPQAVVSGPPALSPGRVKTRPPVVANGRPVPAAYTRSMLGWLPWVAPIADEDLSDKQRAAFDGKPNIDYFRLLAREPEVLVARTAVDDAIFGGVPSGEVSDGEGVDGQGPDEQTPSNLPFAERELAATATSKVNDCLYCASVHARKAAQLTKRTDDVDRLLAIEPERADGWTLTDPAAIAELAAGQEPRWANVITAAGGIAAGSWSLVEESFERLRELGVTDSEVIDLVGAASFFSWANRLMLTLGEPFEPERTRLGQRA